MNVTQRYVRNMKTGVIYPFTPELGKHRHCAVLSLALGKEYERRSAIGPSAIQEMEKRLMDAETAGEAVSADELATTLEQAPAVIGKPTPAVATSPSIPDDFDMDIDLGPMGKPELTAIAKKINFPLPSGMKVAQIREALADFLAEIKASRSEQTTDDGGLSGEVAGESAL